VIVFSVLNALLLRTLGCSSSDRPYNVVRETPGYDNQSYPDYLDFQSKNTTFSATAAYGYRRGLDAGDAAYNAGIQSFRQLLRHAWCTAAYGRLFQPVTSVARTRPLHRFEPRFWISHFNSDPRSLGPPSM